MATDLDHEMDRLIAEAKNSSYCIRQFLKKHDYQLSPGRCSNAMDKVIEIGDDSFVIRTFLHEYYSRLTDDQRKKAMDTVIKIGDRFGIPELLKEHSPHLDSLQVAAIFPIFEQNFLEWEIEIFRLFVKIASHRQVLPFLKKYSDQLNEQRLSIVKERLVEEGISLVRSLTELGYRRLQQPDISQDMKGKFNEWMKLEGAFYSLTHPEVDV
jgi:hypothetical protein